MPIMAVEGACDMKCIFFALVSCAVLVACSDTQVSTNDKTSDANKATAITVEDTKKPVENIVTTSQPSQSQPISEGLQTSSITPFTDAAPTIELGISEILSNLPQYDRDDWKHWIDEDGDCQNARHEVLIDESLADVEFKDAKNCQVALGRWYDPFTAETLTDATKLDVDHMVPLKNAHDSGGWAWNKKRKSDYANYMKYEDHLIAVTASANRKKGAKGPDGWKPSNKAHWCDYATDWIEIKVEWDLTATELEWTALEEMIGTCEQPLLVVAITSQMQGPSPKPVAKSVPTESIKVSNSGASPEIQITALDCKAKPEVVTITNEGDSQQALTGWSIVDQGVKHTFSFPNGFILDTGMSVEVLSGASGDDSNLTLYWKKQTVWNNDGDTATVLDSTGKVIGLMDCP